MIRKAIALNYGNQADETSLERCLCNAAAIEEFRFHCPRGIGLTELSHEKGPLPNPPLFEPEPQSRRPDYRERGQRFRRTRDCHVPFSLGKKGGGAISRCQIIAIKAMPARGLRDRLRKADLNSGTANRKLRILRRRPVNYSNNFGIHYSCRKRNAHASRWDRSRLHGGLDFHVFHSIVAV
jgi:hypothetical protein